MRAALGGGIPLFPIGLTTTTQTEAAIEAERINAAIAAPAALEEWDKRKQTAGSITGAIAIKLRKAVAVRQFFGDDNLLGSYVNIKGSDMKSWQEWIKKCKDLLLYAWNYEGKDSYPVFAAYALPMEALVNSSLTLWTEQVDAQKVIYVRNNKQHMSQKEMDEDWTKDPSRMGQISNVTHDALTKYMDYLQKFLS